MLRKEASVVLRDLLHAASDEIRRDRARTERFRALLRVAHAAGISVKELAHLAELSRPSVYELLSRPAEGPVDDPDELVLAALATQSLTEEQLRDLVKIPEKQLERSIERLRSRQAIDAAAAGYDPKSMVEILRLRPFGERLLEARRHRNPYSSGERWTGYLGVEPGEGQLMLEEARELLGPERAALIPLGTVSGMQTPELALNLDATDEVDLFNQLAATWHSLRQELSLPPAPVRLTAFSPPSTSSSVLAAVTRGALRAEPALKGQLVESRLDAAAEVDEKTICIRALTEAAWALRRLVRQSNRPPILSDGERAFEEFQAASVLELDGAAELAQQALLKALGLAIEKLGPFPGGRLGSIRHPDEPVPVVQAVSPTPSDLHAIAGAAGEVLGFVHQASSGVFSATEVLGRIEKDNPPNP